MDMIRIAAAFAAIGLSASLGAQWLNKTTGIPRKADGTADLSAPAPRLANGKPDFSGMWEHLNSRDSAYYLKGIDIPWRPAVLAQFRENTADNQINNPESRCLPRGVPKADAFDIHKNVHTPELLIILYEYQNMFRQIFLD